MTQQTNEVISIAAAIASGNRLAVGDARASTRLACTFTGIITALAIAARRPERALQLFASLPPREQALARETADAWLAGNPFVLGGER